MDNLNIRQIAGSLGSQRAYFADCYTKSVTFTSTLAVFLRNAKILSKFILYV